MPQKRYAAFERGEGEVTESEWVVIAAALDIGEGEYEQYLG